jgi:hypothetical protein
MRLNLLYANTPRWANRSQTKIDLVVRFDHIDEDLPFCATSTDIEAYGRDIFNRAVAGEFGAIAAFDPTPFTTEFVVAAIKEKRDQMLFDTDWTQLPDVPAETAALWAEYRQALRDLPQQTGFPWYDNVVVQTDNGFGINFDAISWPARPGA